MMSWVIGQTKDSGIELMVVVVVVLLLRVQGFAFGDGFISIEVGTFY